MKTKIREDRAWSCHLGSGAEDTPTPTCWIGEAEWSSEGYLILPAALRPSRPSGTDGRPDGRVWVSLTDEGLYAVYRDGGSERCRLCGGRVDADSPYVICLRCLRDIRETDIAATREVPSA